MEHLSLTIADLDCADCARTLEEGVGRLPGVARATVALLSGTLTVEYEPAGASREQVVARIRELGHDIVVNVKTWVYRVDGMDCADCAAKVEAGVRALPGVRDVQLSFATTRMEVKADDVPALGAAIEARVRELGYAAHLDSGERRSAARPQGGLIAFIRQNRTAWWAAGAAPFLLVGLLFLLLRLPPWLSDGCFGLALVIAGVPVARAGFAALRVTRNLDINVLMSIAAVGAAIVGEWEEGAVAIFLFAIGELLERYTMDRARGAIRALMDLSPEEAMRVVDGHDERVTVEALQAGDTVRLRPGERIPTDGTVLEGHSAVDQAAITGESLPVEKGQGDEVYAGTLNGEGLLLARVTHPASASTLARIIKMVEEAQARKAPAQRFVDRFARIYTPAVVGMAVLVSTIPPILLGMPFVPWFYRALTMLVIACPCALVLSTPISIAAAIAAAARQGVLVKGGAHLEALGSIKALALDKTGTLTEGRPAVTAVTAYGGHGEGEVLQVAAAVESGSMHPLARAIMHEARRRGLALLPAQDLQSLTGRGATAVVGGERFYVGNHTFLESCGRHTEEVCREVDNLEAKGQTVILVCNEGELLGTIALADRLRPQSQAAVQELRRAGVGRVVMLTGDNRPTADAIARQAGVDDVRANLLPEQKVDAVEALLQRYGTVGMVGDGVNDAPALARATVGVAMGAIGSDAALETADVALMTDELERLPWAIRLGQRTRRTIGVNIALALGLKAIFLGLAVFGLATLWMAVFADMGASLLVTLNGMRLLLPGRGSDEAIRR
jgi:Cd2+/Zn2+-exporting ATPase